MKKTKNYYNHDELFHAICVEKFCPELNFAKDINETLLLEKLSECYSDKYRNFGFNATVSEVKLNKENRFPIQLMDIIVL